MIETLIFVIGLVIGSFLNVCIYRMPRNESIVSPGSRCINCKKPIPWYDNIPLLSYIALAGKCRFCKNKISFRYFLVELVSGLAFLSLYLNFGMTEKFSVYSVLTFSLIAVTFIDLEFQIIPDIISLGGMVLGVALSVIMPAIHNVSVAGQSVFISLIGLLAGGSLIYLTGVLGKLAFKKESMGGGDVKLMAMLGAFLGWKKIILVFFLAPFFGSPPGIYLKFKKKSDIIPYGPFIAIAAFVVMIWGEKILKLLFL